MREIINYKNEQFISMSDILDETLSLHNKLYKL